VIVVWGKRRGAMSLISDPGTRENYHNQFRNFRFPDMDLGKPGRIRIVLIRNSRCCKVFSHGNLTRYRVRKNEEVVDFPAKMIAGVPVSLHPGRVFFCAGGEILALKIIAEYSVLLYTTFTREKNDRVSFPLSPGVNRSKKIRSMVNQL
jgi:hypothetical protein